MISSYRSRFLSFAFLLAIVMTSFIGLVQAQSYPQYLLETGSPTFVTPEPTTMGFINVANGNLHIEIPFVSTPQRGGRPFVAKMVYDSRIWKILDTGYSRSWQPTNVPGYPGPYPWGGWRFVATGLADGQSDYLIHACDDEGDFIWEERKNYRLYDVDGTVRRFPLHWETSEYCHTAGPATTTGPALDATGFVMNSDPCGRFPPSEVIAPDGTAVWKRPCSSSVVWKDPNGNFMEKDVSGNVVDTLNRTVVRKQSVVGTEADYVVMASNAFSTFHVSSSGTSQPPGGCTYFQQAGVTEYCGGVGGLIAYIQLPDGTRYEFTYEFAYGLMKTMKLPTGETITFTHNNFTDALGGKHRWLNTVSAAGGTWTFTPTTCGANCNKLTVTRPSGDETVYTSTLDTGGNGAWNTLSKSYTGSAASGTLALTVQNDYDTSLTNPLNGGSGFVRRIRATTTWPGPAGDLVRKDEATYDTFTYNYGGTNYTGSRGNVLTRSEFAYGSGAAGGLLRTQVFAYLQDSNSSYIAKNIVNRVTNVQTQNAAGTKIAEMITTYDSTALTSMTGITHHDDAGFGTGFTLRGNPTVTKIWSGSGSSTVCTDLNYLCTTRNYDMTGQAVSTSDPKSVVTQFSFADNFSQMPSTPTNAYLTQVTLPVSGTLTYRYWYNSGKVQEGKDQNDNATSAAYNDPLDRLTNTTVPGGGWAQAAYPTATQTNYTASLWGSTTADAQRTLDTMGRVKQENLVVDKSDPENWVWAWRDTSYDTSGRLQSVTNWYSSVLDPTYGLTSYQYDSLNRIKRTTLQDGNYTETFYGSGVGAAGGRTTQLCASGTYGLGYPTLSKDEAGKKRQVWTDAFGNLMEADEPDASGALTLGTCYQYNILGSLIQVDQGDRPPRTMAYDALSRLVTETTPEGGTITLFYTTSGGALCAGNPTALCRSTDARGITTTYTYDAENRLTGKTYSNGDPAVSYFYDQTSYNGLNIAAGRGRRTGMSDGSGQTAWSFNGDGRPVIERRTIAGVTKSFSYAYNLNGSVSDIYYPGSMNLHYSYDSAGRLNQLYCLACTITFFVDSPTYAPHGALASAVIGNSGAFQGITTTYTYNKRLQPVNLKATHTNGTVTVMDYTYSFVSGTINDGQVKSVTNNLATGRSQTYTYDEMNRLATAQSQANSGADCWGLGYGYDRYANLLSASVTKCSAPALSVSVNNNNRITNIGFTYDLAGNMTADGLSTFTWNAEGRMASTAGVTYDYDGDGKRVKKSNGRLYWYGMNGEVLAESDLSGNVAVEYIYVDGRRIARRVPSSGVVHYYLADHLKSARVLTNSTGGVVEESDFYPFGTERVITDSLDNNYKFTGLERDAESGLDHTLYRQYSASLGRWLSADPVACEASGPQSLNRYPYVRNDPANFTDPDGRLQQNVYYDSGFCVPDPSAGIGGFFDASMPCPPGYRFTGIGGPSTGSQSRLREIWELFDPLMGLIQDWEYANEAGTRFNVTVSNELYDALVANGFISVGAGGLLVGTLGLPIGVEIGVGIILTGLTILAVRELAQAIQQMQVTCKNVGGSRPQTDDPDEEIVCGYQCPGSAEIIWKTFNKRYLIDGWCPEWITIFRFVIH